MNLGVPPTEEKALTGEFTPPGMTAHASAKSAAEAATDNGAQVMTTSVPARSNASTTGCSGSALAGDDEHRVVGLARQPAEVAFDGAAGLLAIGGEHRLTVLFGDFPRDVCRRPDRRVRVGAQVLHPFGFAARGHQVSGAADVDRYHWDLLWLLAAAPGHGQLLGVAHPGRHGDLVEDRAGEPWGLEIGHGLRV